MLDNLTEKFGFRKKPKRKPSPKDYHIPHCKDGQWYYGYEKVYIRTYPACTFPLYNGKMDPCSKDT